jgi:hypothetical protein
MDAPVHTELALLRDRLLASTVWTDGPLPPRILSSTPASPAPSTGVPAAP